MFVLETSFPDHEGCIFYHFSGMLFVVDTGGAVVSVAMNVVRIRHVVVPAAVIVP